MSGRNPDPENLPPEWFATQEAGTSVTRAMKGVTEDSIQKERATIRWNPDGSRTLQEVVDDAPENARIVGHRETVVETDEILVETDGLELANLNLRLAEQGQNLLNVQASDVAIRDSEFDGDSEPGVAEESGQDALVYIGGDTEIENVRLDNVDVHHAADSGVAFGTDTRGFESLERSSNVAVTNSRAWACGDDGFTTHRVDGGLFLNCQAWDMTGEPGNSWAFEIEWGSNNIDLINCFGWGTPTDPDENSGGAFTLKSGGGNPPWNIQFQNCHSLGDVRWGFRLVAEDPENFVDERGAHGVVLSDCTAHGWHRDGWVQCIDYDVQIRGGRFSAQGEDDPFTGIVADDGAYDSAELKISDAELVNEEITVRGSSTADISDVEIVDSGTRQILFEDSSSGSLVGDETVWARDSAGPIVVRSIDDPGDFDEQDNATIVLKDPSVVTDVTEFSAERGARAYHDGTTGTEGPAYADGTNWTSLVDGSTL